MRKRGFVLASSALICGAFVAPTVNAAPPGVECSVEKFGNAKPGPFIQKGDGKVTAAVYPPGAGHFRAHVSDITGDSATAVNLCTVILDQGMIITVSLGAVADRRFGLTITSDDPHTEGQPGGIGLVDTTD